MAFDLPTQMGLDSDHPMAMGEVGRVGVAISSLADMETLFQGIRLDGVSTSMTINSTASILLALYALVARRQGADWRKLRARSRTTSSRSTSRAAHIFIRLGRRCASSPISSLGRTRSAGVEYDLDQRISHPRSGIDGGAGTGFHVRQCDRVYRCGDPRRVWMSIHSRRAFRSSSMRITISWRRSRSSAPRGASTRS